MTSATFTDGAATSVNDVATTIATAVRVVLETKEFKTPNVDGPYVLPGDLIQYRVKVRNKGGVPTQGGKLTLSWSGDVPYTIETPATLTARPPSVCWSQKSALAAPVKGP